MGIDTHQHTQPAQAEEQPTRTIMHIMALWLCIYYTHAHAFLFVTINT